MNNNKSINWYNNHIWLWLSVLFWPLFIYGFYKTNLVSIKTKRTVAVVFGGLILLNAMSKSKEGNTNDIVATNEIEIPMQSVYTLHSSEELINGAWAFWNSYEISVNFDYNIMYIHNTTNNIMDAFNITNVKRRDGTIYIKGPYEDNRYRSQTPDSFYAELRDNALVFSVETRSYYGAGNYSTMGGKTFKLKQRIKL